MRRYKYIYLLVPRRSIVLRVALILVLILPLMCCWLLLDSVANGLLPPNFIPDLEHLQRNRNLKDYLDEIQLLVEPSTPSCDENLLVLVTSSPNRFEHRTAIRETWGRRLRTFFVLGIDGYHEEDFMADNYIEAKLHSDMIVYQFRDHYQNLTLKSGLMMRWTLERCPRAKFLLKTDDDVLVNPVMMKRIVEQADDDLIGYRKENSYLHRDPTNKWYVPRYLHRDDYVPRYLSGTGYLVNVKRIPSILEAAYKIPMINLEDVYFTYLVSNLTLNLNLTHDRRLSPYKPWLPLKCLYYQLASAHSLSPTEIKKWGTILLKMADHVENNDKLCYSYGNFSEWLLF